MELAQFNTMIATAGEELAPHKVCAYIYDLANAFNHFYHETKILGEENEERKQGLVALLVLTRDILETCIDMLGFEARRKCNKNNIYLVNPLKNGGHKARWV